MFGLFKSKEQKRQTAAERYLDAASDIISPRERAYVLCRIGFHDPRLVPEEGGDIEACRIHVCCTRCNELLETVPRAKTEARGDDPITRLALRLYDAGVWSSEEECAHHALNYLMRNDRRNKDQTATSAPALATSVGSM